MSYYQGYDQGGYNYGYQGDGWGDPHAGSNQWGSESDSRAYAYYGGSGHGNPSQFSLCVCVCVLCGGGVPIL